MRVLRSLPFIALLAAGCAAARSLEVRSPALDDHALIDVCAAIDIDLEVELLGIPIVVGKLAPKSHCTFPEHATPICLNGDPCGFDCKDGFTPFPAKKPTECVCDLPKTVCNSVCGKFPHCASAKPLAKRNLLEGSGACASHGEGWLACGVFLTMMCASDLAFYASRLRRALLRAETDGDFEDELEKGMEVFARDNLGVEVTAATFEG
ncbi:hypothetical protein EWM64_g4030 [Hericium alpestre]|uniref:Uncharacterized protein n=1 Tax=Hericium alpestre TaxID=135208 RepID=A0A4Z0A1B9_9AGAM|nr:hypothetical protein EWM64_g4030 [Hericium alpestre]